MTRRPWLRIPALLLAPALGALAPLPRMVPLSVSERAEARCRAIGACDTSAACGPAACAPCPGSSCGGPAAAPDDASPDTAAPDESSSPAPRGIVCLCCQCGQGVPAVSPDVAPPALAAVLSEAPPGALASVSREPASPPPKVPPIVS